MKLFKLAIGVFVSMITSSMVLWVDDPKTAGKEPEPAKAEPETPEVDIDAMIEKAKEDARAEALKEAEGKYKKEISTRDQAITKLQKDVNATKSEEERKQIEAEERQKSILEGYSKLAVKAAGLDENFSDLITGNSQDEINAKIEVFAKVKESIEKPLQDAIKTHLEKIKSLEDEIKILKASGPPPPAGSNTEPVTLQNAYDEAKKNNNFAQQTAILREAGRRGVEIRQ